MKLLLVASFLSMGCASRQAAPAMPTSPCDQCYAQVKEAAKDKAALFTVEAATWADKALHVLKESEEYLSKKINEWKATHPEWVAKAQEQLDSIRAKIDEYETRAKEKFSSHK